MIKFLKLYEKIGIFILIVLASVVLSIMSPHFLQVRTLLSIAAQGTYAAIIGFGMTLALTMKAFDLSVDAVLALTSVFVAIFIPMVGVPLAIVFSLLIAASVGMVNGLIVTKLGVNPLITTLAMMTIIRGIALLVVGGRQVIITDPDRVFRVIGTGRIFGIPNQIYIMLLLFAIFFIMLYHTPFGRHISAVGSNESAARISGLRVDLIKIAVFMLVSFTAGVVGIIRTSQSLIGIPTMAPDFVLVVLTVAILGGTSLAGGKGNLWGTLFAGIFISMIYYGLNLLGVQIFYQIFSVGLVLLFALFVDGIRTRYLAIAKAKGIKM